MKRFACIAAFGSILVAGLAAQPPTPAPQSPAPQPRKGLRHVGQAVTTGADALVSMAKADAERVANKTVRLFGPRLVFPDGPHKVDAEGLIPIRVTAKVKNLGRDRPVYWKVQSTRVTQAGRETVWSGSYDHLKFVIKKDTDEDRVFTERIQMPPGYYHILVSLCDDGVKPDWETGEPVNGRAIVSAGFHVTVP